jgi:hypothetical protein
MNMGHIMALYFLKLICMLRGGRVYDPEHGYVGAATFVGLILFTESPTRGVLLCCTVQTKYPNGGNDLYDLHLLVKKIRLRACTSLSPSDGQMILSLILLHHTQQSGGFLLES